MSVIRLACFSGSVTFLEDWEDHRCRVQFMIFITLYCLWSILLRALCTFVPRFSGCKEAKESLQRACVRFDQLELDRLASSISTAVAEELESYNRTSDSKLLASPDSCSLAEPSGSVQDTWLTVPFCWRESLAREFYCREHSMAAAGSAMFAHKIGL